MKLAFACSWLARGLLMSKCNATPCLVRRVAHEQVEQGR